MEVNRGRALVELKRVRKSKKPGASFRFLNGRVSGDSASCNTDLELSVLKNLGNSS